MNSADLGLYQTPPQNIELEQSVLNQCLYQPDDVVFDILKPSDFYKTAHQKIFKACAILNNEGDPIDIISVKTKLHDEGLLETSGGATYLSSLMDVPIPTNIEYACRKLSKYSKLRKMIEISNAISKRCFQTGSDGFDEVLDYAQSEILGIDSTAEHSWKHIKDILVECIEHCEAIAERGGVTGIPSGFYDLDAFTCGWQPGDLILIAGRPSMGKTALADCCITNAAKVGFKSGMCSLEMAKVQIGNRLISSESRINSLKFKSGRFGENDWLELHNTASKLSEMPIWIDDSPRSSYKDIQKKARYAVKNFGIHSLWIDYLGFIDGDKEDGVVREIQSISRGLKATAKELNIPIILVCQLSRECEKRSNKRPILSDLRESGALEQDADVVIFIYRDEVYYGEDCEDKGIAELDIAKQRNGPTGVVRLAWLEGYTRFENLGSEYS